MTFWEFMQYYFLSKLVIFGICMGVGVFFLLLAIILEELGKKY